MTEREREKERDSEAGRESKKKHVMLQNVQDAAWNETSHPKLVHV